MRLLGVWWVWWVWTVSGFEHSRHPVWPFLSWGKRIRSVTTTLGVHQHIAPITKKAPPVIVLTEEEKKLFGLLNHVAMVNGTTLRVAGGWVRDKLLYQQGGEVVIKPDIDIALDDQLGTTFASQVAMYHEREGVNIGSFPQTILKNPEKSKHLETCNMLINGFSVDFVNLRTEAYTGDSSRANLFHLLSSGDLLTLQCTSTGIPTAIDIGTPVEDAFRRDLTINALFYNLRTGEVEDLTGRGLDDLEARLVATPLPATVTLLDDPLRLLRAVRFATRCDAGPCPCPTRRRAFRSSFFTGLLTELLTAGF